MFVKSFDLKIEGMVRVRMGKNFRGVKRKLDDSFYVGWILGGVFCV